MSNEIFEYIRRRKSGKMVKAGVVLGTVDKGVIKIGWSKCNIQMDEFNKEMGLIIARNRCTTPDHVPIPDCIRRQVRRFGARAVRYYKDAHVMIMDSSI